MAHLKEIGVAVLGFGTVGAGVVETLQQNGELLTERLGLRLVLRGVADVDLDTDRGVAVDRALLTTDAPALIERDDVDVVVELIGGSGVARDFILQALKRGKPVVTANKKLLAEHGEELHRVAAEHQTELLFEAAVGGGIPIIKALREGLMANRIESIYGILNGTCNYILTRMEDEGLPFDEVLAAAQAAGYAEAEPSLDIDGYDTAHKAAVLASLAYGCIVPLEQVQITGIRGVAAADISCAARMGYRIKLLAIIQGGAAGVEVSVQPTLVAHNHQLAAVGGVYNAVLVHGDVVGTTLYYGRGAGRAATASAVVADLADVALNLRVGGRRWDLSGVRTKAPVVFRDPGEIVARHYVRFSMRDQAGMLAKVAAVLGSHGIGIDSVMQQEAAADAQYVPVIFVTAPARDTDLAAALRTISEQADVTDRAPVRYRIEDSE
ncbi:MAG: homoserine dehydrogenase [Kiritimatiellae bacterium]|jgi:homoserine dehydrogenase|nr:homoserine dehydrogenase [Kiritimatiellia bacterium]MDD4342227.1 homoserine dehydrogenase [Kiritimatiellia bacterium]MDY0150377.1 homoserine dehydrogenase [Kiritimatiellia bacterium]